MPTITRFLLAGGDDGCRNAGWDTAGATVTVGDIGGVSQGGFYRIRLNIPQGTEIVTGTQLMLHCPGNDAGTTCKVAVYAVDADNAAAPADGAAFDALTLTAAHEHYTIAALNNAFYSIPLVTQLQEVVNRDNWVANNYATVVILNDGSTADAHRHFDSYDGDADGVHLTLVYELPVATVAVKVEVNKDHSWYDRGVSDEWTDITDQVRSWSVSSRTSQDRWRAGTATITLANGTRLWEPGYSADARVGLPIRMTVEISDGYNGFAGHLYSGYAESFTVKYEEGDGDSVCVIEAADLLSILAGIRCAGTEVASAHAADQIAEILTDAGYAGYFVGIDMDTTLQVHTPAATGSVLEAIEQVAQSAGGVVYLLPVIGAYDLLYGSGPAYQTWNGARVTFGELATEIPYRDASPKIDMDLLVNQARVTRVGGVTQTAEDTTSMRAYGVRSDEQSGLLLLTDAECATRAQAIVDWYDTPTAYIAETETFLAPGISQIYHADPILTQLMYGYNDLTTPGNGYGTALALASATINRRPKGGTVRACNVRYRGASWSGAPRSPIRITCYWAPALTD